MKGGFVNTEYGTYNQYGDSRSGDGSINSSYGTGGMNGSGVNPFPCIIWVTLYSVTSLLSILLYPIYAPARELYRRIHPPKARDDARSPPAVKECLLGCKDRGCKTCIQAAILSPLTDSTSGTRPHGLKENTKRLMTWRDKGSYDDGYSITVTILKVDDANSLVDIQYDYGLVEHKVPFHFFFDNTVVVGKLSDKTADVTAVAVAVETAAPSNDVESQELSPLYFCYYDNRTLPFCSFWNQPAAWYLQSVPGGDSYSLVAEGRYPSPATHNGAWTRNGTKYKVDFVKVKHSSGDARKEAFAFRYHKASYTEPKYADMASSGIFEEVNEAENELAREYKAKCTVESAPEGFSKVYERVRVFQKGEMKKIFGSRQCYKQGFMTMGVLEMLSQQA